MTITQQIGKRGVMFAYEDGDFNYVIYTDRRVFICDTHMGPVSMDDVKAYLNAHGLLDREIIIFNSHADIDHIWGNCAFPEATVISCTACRESMQERGPFELETFRRFQSGEVVLRYPDLTFASKLTFADDEVEFLYMPGHTACSAVCFDRKESVLYAGDMVEGEIPVVGYENLAAYIESLHRIQGLGAKTIVTAHSGIADEGLLVANIAYLQSLLAGQSVEVAGERFIKRHDYNQKKLMILRYTALVREKLASGFDYRAFKRDFGEILQLAPEEMDCEYTRILEMEYGEIESAMQKYVASLTKSQG